jgi:hypothetical protein
MKHILTYSLLVFLCLAASAAQAQAAAKPSVKILPSSGPKTVGKSTVVTFKTKVTGITLDARHIGKPPQAGHGHLQVYVDGIPSDAWTKNDLQHHWLASVASPTFTLRLSPAILGGNGKHHIIIALASNNNVLLKAPTASITLTVKG